MGQWSYIKNIIKETSKNTKHAANSINTKIKNKADPNHIEYIKNNAKNLKKEKNYAIDEGIQENRLFHHSTKKKNIDDVVNYNADLDNNFKTKKSKQYMLKQKKFMFDKEFSN